MCVCVCACSGSTVGKLFMAGRGENNADLSVNYTGNIVSETAVSTIWGILR